jgi:hypothetical protein
MGQQVHRVPAFQSAIAPADRGPNRIYDHSFAHDGMISGARF